MWKPAGEPKYSSSAAAAAVTCLLVTGTLMVTVGHPSAGDPEEPPVAATSGKVFTAYFRKLTRERRAISAPPRSSGPPPPVEHLSPADLFIAVKTTGRYHRQRLQLLLDTWISRNMQQVSYGVSDGWMAGTWAASLRVSSFKVSPVIQEVNISPFYCAVLWKPSSKASAHNGLTLLII